MANYINNAVIEQSIAGIKGILQDHQKDIEQAYLNEENSLTVSIGLKYYQEKNGIRIETGMNLVKERLKIKTSIVVDDNQLPLFSADENMKVKRIS